MSREQSIKSLLSSKTETPETYDTHGPKLFTAVILGMVLGSGLIGGIVYSYGQGYKKGIEVASSESKVARAAYTLAEPSAAPSSYLLELPPAFEEQGNTRVSYDYY